MTLASKIYTFESNSFEWILFLIFKEFEFKKIASKSFTIRILRSRTHTDSKEFVSNESHTDYRSLRLSLPLSVSVAKSKT